jgi:hypothetical protein
VFGSGSSGCGCSCEVTKPTTAASDPFLFCFGTFSGFERHGTKDWRRPFCLLQSWLWFGQLFIEKHCYRTLGINRQLLVGNQEVARLHVLTASGRLSPGVMGQWEKRRRSLYSSSFRALDNRKLYPSYGIYYTSFIPESNID